MTLALILSVILAQGQDPPRLGVSPLPQTLVLDGRMREPVWTTADSAVLTEFEPELGTVPAERTVVKVLASADELVFGIRCDDPEPDKLTSFARARDADLSAEDHVRIVLDPFLNEQSGYVFAVNPNGARYDALISEQAQRLGGRENPDWDTIWEAATARSGEGWSVEIRIPVKSLLYKPGLAEWGFNVQRRVQRKLETERWAFPGRNWRITQMSRAGRLFDLPDFSLARGLSVRPALVLASGIPAPAAAWTNSAAGSLDGTQRIGSNTLGVLAVRTGAVPGLVPATDMGVVRVKQNILGESSVGFIGTAGDPTGATGSWLAGTDVLLSSSHVLGDKNVQLGLWGLETDGRSLSGSRTAAGVSLFYPNDTWNNFLGYSRVGDGFQPALGFVPRPGVQQVHLALNYLPRAT